MVDKQAASNDGSATGGDLASAKPRFQDVSHWLRRLLATRKEDYKTAGRCERATAECTPAASSGRVPMAARLGPGCLARSAVARFRSYAGRTAFRMGYALKLNEIVSSQGPVGGANRLPRGSAMDTATGRRGLLRSDGRIGRRRRRLRLPTAVHRATLHTVILPTRWSVDWAGPHSDSLPARRWCQYPCRRCRHFCRGCRRPGHSCHPRS